AIARAAPDASASANASAPPAPEPPKTWADCVRLARWSDAAERIDALEESDRNKPEIKYVRARVAIAMGDHAKAAALLQHLESDLPALATDIARYRAEAQLEAGPYSEAATFFSRSNKSRDLAHAADAYQKAGDL